MDSRSETYLNAAKNLRDDRKYNPATALAYYAAFMYMRYVWANANVNAVDYQSQNPLNEDVHNRVFTNVADYLASHRGDENKFRSSWDNLSNLRHKADYEKNDITDTECCDAIDCAERLIKMMKKLPLRSCNDAELTYQEGG